MLISQITDLHVGQLLEAGGRTIDTLGGVTRAVAALNALSPRPEAVLVTGDLVAEERRDTYRAVAAALGDLAMPHYVVPGNHDDRALMREAFGAAGYLPRDGEFLHYTVEDFALRLVALDTQDPGRDGGRLGPARLDWLEERLAAAPERPTLIAMHHPPVTVGMPDFDAIGLTGREAFGEIVARHPQVLGIACGHVHRDIVAAWCGALVAVTPGTGYQYALRLPPERGFVKVPEPPAIRHFLWREDAGLVSHIGYVAG